MFFNLWNSMLAGGKTPVGASPSSVYGNLGGTQDRYGSAINNILMSLQRGGNQWGGMNSMGVRPLVSNKPGVTKSLSRDEVLAALNDRAGQGRVGNQWGSIGVGVGVPGRR